MTQTPPFGAPATVGARLAAFSIDAALVIAVGVAGAVLGSPLFGAALAADALLGLWIVQARRGSSPGALLLRVRTTRLDDAVTPGAGRAFVRGALVLLGGLVLVLGAWAVVLTAAADRTGRRRSWADRAAGTQLVAVPDRRGIPDAIPATALATPTVHARTPAARGPLRVDPAAAALPLAPAWEAAPPALPAAAQALPAETSDATPEGVASLPPVENTATAVPAAAGARATPVPLPAPAEPVPTAPAPAPAVAGLQLLVTFDTGQRAQFDLPAAVNFGRAPAATQPDDVLIAVDDPDRLVSKTHLRLEHDGETAWVVDAGSTNGSELVGDDAAATVLQPGVRTPLEEGTRVRLGERVFTLTRLIGGPV